MGEEGRGGEGRAWGVSSVNGLSSGFIVGAGSSQTKGYGSGTETWNLPKQPLELGHFAGGPLDGLQPSLPNGPPWPCMLLHMFYKMDWHNFVWGVFRVT